MPDLMDRLYCSEQIHIPPTFPFIMKLYCKAAIRTQPYDLLKWSAAYFRALANGEEPPVKDRIEYPPYDSPTGLTPGYIKMLIKQLGKDPATVVTAQTLFVKWNCVCLEDELLVKLLALMGARTEVNWLKFVAVACGFICSSLTNTMILLCEVLTDEPEGGMATIPLEVFTELYSYLAAMECGPLTEEELKQMEEIKSEEDVSAIAEKIRVAIYVDEEEGEGMSAPEETEIEEPHERELSGEDALPVEPEEEALKTRPVTAADEPEAEAEEKGNRGTPSEAAAEEEETGKEKDQDAEFTESPRNADEASEEGTDDGDLPRLKSSQRSLSMENEEIMKEEALDDLEETSLEKKEIGKETEEEESKSAASETATADVEESIRAKMEEKLGEEEESGKSDEEDFEQLDSYLLGASARLKKYTEEEIGYRVFKRYLRQEVDGIGPSIESVEVEKVIDFMDYSAHKQGGMVMPRNIRHWMCPPLDKMPAVKP